MNTARVLSGNLIQKKPGARLAAIALAFAAVLLFSAGAALAQGDKGGYTGPGGGGGYTGPGPDFVTAKQAKDLSDDTSVALRGYIVKHLGGENYLFKDDTGSLTEEISDKRWQGQMVSDKDLVEIYGKIDKDWSEFEVEVKRLIKQ